MSTSCLQWLLPAALIVVASATQAQPVAVPVGSGQRSDPGDPAAPTMPLHHRSSFESYRAPKPAVATDWLEANREVAAVGGWRAYAREAQAADPAASAVVPEARVQGRP